MIPIFLKALAAQVRARVADGGAVHVTEQAALEMELLAGLDWSELCIEGPCQNVPGEQRVQPSCRPLVTIADIALGWLLVSKVFVVVPDELLAKYGSGEPAIWIDTLAIGRAAACAELAVISARLVVSDNSYWQRKPVGANPHDGTREGARAAWGFVAGRLNDKLYETSPRCSHMETQLAETYRRELEAMR